MSRYYRMDIEISEFNPRNIDAITEAASDEWPDWDGWDHVTDLSCSGEGNLCGGESEEEFTFRVCLAVWKANKGYCKVVVTATCLENLPQETYSGRGRYLYGRTLNKEQYDKAFGKGKKVK